MKKWQRNIVDRLVDATNQIGSVSDMTAISTKRLIACTKANMRAYSILVATFYEEDKCKAERLINELELLTKWNFPDKIGRLSNEEKQLNKRLEAIAKENGLEFFFSR